MNSDIFGTEKPTCVCDSCGLDENDAIRHFQDKERNEIDYTDSILIEDLMWMSHDAFKYYLPGFLYASLHSDDDELASYTLSAIQSHVSGPRVKRIQFTEDQRRELKIWLATILDKYGGPHDCGLTKRITKYGKRI